MNNGTMDADAYPIKLEEDLEEGEIVQPCVGTSQQCLAAYSSSPPPSFVDDSSVLRLLDTPSVTATGTDNTVVSLCGKFDCAILRR
jgi:hypothetical protein